MAGELLIRGNARIAHPTTLDILGAKKVLHRKTKLMFADVQRRLHFSKRPTPYRPCSDLREPGNTGSNFPRSLVTRRLQNLTAVLHISLLRRDTKHAQRAFAMLLRCERHGVSLKALWDLGAEILFRSSVEHDPKLKAEEFLARVRLSSSDVGHHPTTQKQVRSRMDRR